MKKSNFVLVIFLLIGMLAGTIVSQLLEPVSSLKFLTESTKIVWQPKADLKAISFDLRLQVKLTLLSVAGMAAAFWLYRRL